MVKNSTVDAMVIWRLVDGKVGHEHQSAGLIAAIQQRKTVQVYEIMVSNAMDGLVAWLSKTWHWGAHLPAPDLIIGAGHKTHMHMLAAKRAYGGKTVCLMQPTLPVWMFDVCLIPEHDAYQGWGSYIETRGVLNHIFADNTARESNRAVILVGGPSKHFIWDTAKVVTQIYALLHQNPETHYVLTTSRRTPENFVKAMQLVDLPNVEMVPFSRTDKDWVSRELNRVANVWVTEDSISMIYEGLTAHAAVGLINLECKKPTRVGLGVQRLVGKGLVRRFDVSGSYRAALQPAYGFNEAQRCSDLLLKHLYQPAVGKKTRLAYRLA